MIGKQFSGNNCGYQTTVVVLKIAKQLLKIKEIYHEVYRDNISAIFLTVEMNLKKNVTKKEFLRNGLC